MKNLFLALACVIASGCAATQVTIARESITTSVSLFSGAVKALDAADQSTQSALVDKVKAGTLSSADAQAQYDVFNAKYDTAMKALNTLWDVIQAAANTTAAADAKLKSDLPGAVTALQNAVGNVVNALTALNIKIPGVN